MCLSNEPGYYESGAFGIRIESIMACVKAQTKYNFPKDKQYLAFDTITLVPLQQKLMQLQLLDAKERAWINAYHQECKAKVRHLLSEQAKKWFDHETQEIPLH